MISVNAIYYHQRALYQQMFSFVFHTDVHQSFWVSHFIVHFIAIRISQLSLSFSLSLSLSLSHTHTHNYSHTRILPHPLTNIHTHYTHHLCLLNLWMEHGLNLTEHKKITQRVLLKNCAHECTRTNTNNQAHTHKRMQTLWHAYTQIHKHTHTQTLSLQRQYSTVGTSGVWPMYVYKCICVYVYTNM